MLHDERFFDEPDVFRPERYLANSFGVKDGVEDDPARKEHLLFGGGRRVCPGVLFANSTMVGLSNSCKWMIDRFVSAHLALDSSVGISVLACSRCCWNCHSY